MCRLAQLKETSDFLGFEVTVTEEDKVNTFLGIIKDLVVKKSDDYPDSLFFCKNDTIYVELSTKNGNLYCNYPLMWRVFQREYLMQFIDIQSFIKTMVEQHMELKDITPIIPHIRNPLTLMWEDIWN